jgi:iron complex outermembrane receptor protein
VRDTALDEGTVPLNVYAQRDATLRGAEGQIETEFISHLVVGVVGDVVRGRFTDGDRLPFLPSARLGGSVRWDKGGWYAGADVRHGFAQTQVSQATCVNAAEVSIGVGGELPSDPSTGRPCVDIPTPAYTVVNLNTGFTWLARSMSHSLTLRADNVGDTRYFDAASRIKSFTANPGRNLSVVYRLLY